LMHYPPFTPGKTVLFGKPFRFSDCAGYLHSVDEIFGEDVYKFTTASNSPYIIDCGANMGLSILYFKQNYPDSTILAFEPDHKTFNILKENAFHFHRVTLKEEAVWTHDTTLNFYSEGSLAGSAMVDFANKNDKTSVNAIDLKKHLNKKVDFLKIDIEGAENELIFDIKDHLSQVDKMFLEYHGLIDQPQNLGEILNLLKEAGFQYYIRLAGETMKFPFCDEKPTAFNQQLNIFCYRS
ncbi:MAG: FkbM family methyltransferase, partial [Kaistella sp.]